MFEGIFEKKTFGIPGRISWEIERIFRDLFGKKYLIKKVKKEKGNSGNTGEYLKGILENI